MTIRLVTDSTCDLPQPVVERFGITVVPLTVTAGDDQPRQRAGKTRGEFEVRLPGMRHSPGTAAPAAATFRETYARLAAEGADQILSIHLAQMLSATIERARQAAADTTQADVIAFDSRQLSLGMGFQVEAAARAAADGRSLPEILDLLDGQIRRTRVFAALDTLDETGRRNPLIGPIAAVGNMLQIKPILKVYEGEATAERVRTQAGALRRLRELVAENAPYERVGIFYSGPAERAAEFAGQAHDLLPEGELWQVEINSVLGAHIGPDVIGFAGISGE